jgi:hypothetical protein
LSSAPAGADHAITPEPEPAPELIPVAARETCTTFQYGPGLVETDCRMQQIAAPQTNPALKGICTVYYGRRTCH